MAMKVKVHISLIGGQWRATPGNNNAATRAALVPAISYCDRMNDIQKRGKSRRARLAARRWARRQGAE